VTAGTSVTQLFSESFRSTWLHSIKTPAAAAADDDDVEELLNAICATGAHPAGNVTLAADNITFICSLSTVRNILGHWVPAAEHLGPMETLQTTGSSGPAADDLGQLDRGRVDMNRDDVSVGVLRPVPKEHRGSITLGIDSSLVDVREEYAVAEDGLSSPGTSTASLRARMTPFS